MGRNVDLDLSEHADDRFDLTVTPLDGNRTRIVKAVLVDADGTQGVWHFVLPSDAPDRPVTLEPQDGRPLSQPLNNNYQPGTTPGLDLANIVQWQIHATGRASP